MESGIRIQKSLESGIQRLGIRNPALGIQNPPYDWIPLHGAICCWQLSVSVDYTYIVTPVIALYVLAISKGSLFNSLPRKRVCSRSE